VSKGAAPRRIILPPSAYHDGQKRLAREKRRFNVACMGRRFGKTYFGLEQVLFEPGGAIDGRPTAWFSPSYKLMTDVWRDAERTLGKVARRASRTEWRMELITGGQIDFWTLEDLDAGRGRKYARIVIDEAAHSRHLADVWNHAIAPTLTDYKGEAWFISTPAGHNFFRELYRRGDPENPDRRADWQSWRMPTLANPHLDPAEIEQWRDVLPERIYAQEYEAVFLDSGGGVFRRVTDAIDEKLTDGLGSAADPLDDLHRYVIGADWGRHNDFSVFTVVDAANRSVVEVERYNKIEYTFQIQRLATLCQRFPGAPIIAESNSMGEPVIEQLRRRDLTVRAFHTSNASKAEIIESLALAFDEGSISLPKYPPLIGELMSFDQERLPSGAIRYAAPSGGHDDCVMSLALAWHGAKSASAGDYGVAHRGR
jgi:hypothetical protein